MKQHWTNILKFVIPYILVVGVFEYITSKILGVEITAILPSNLSNVDDLILRFSNSLGTAVIVWIFVKNVDKVSFKDFGFKRYKVLTDFKIGLILGFVIMFVGFVSLLITDQIFIKNFTFSDTNLINNILIFAFVSFSEELLVRGYILQNLKVSMTENIALLLSAMIFSLLHFANPNLSSIAFVNLFLAGVVLGLCYLLTKNLWLPFALHFSWNFFQGSIFGFNVSGNKKKSIIEIGYQTETIWNGGAFGFEGSILCIILQIVAIFYLRWLLKNRLNNHETQILELD